jgi:hypothetical protein
VDYQHWVRCGNGCDCADAPLIILYPIWMTGCVMYAWAAWTRKSFGMLANYILLIAIDSVGLFRMIAGIV